MRLAFIYDTYGRCGNDKHTQFAPSDGKPNLFSLNSVSRGDYTKTCFITGEN